MTKINVLSDQSSIDKFAPPNRLAWTYKIIAFFANCCLRYFIKRASKTPVFERPINVSNDKRSELRLAIKSMFSTTSCVCNLGSLKIYLVFFLSISGRIQTLVKNRNYALYMQNNLCSLHLTYQSRQICFDATATRKRSSPSFLSVVTSPSSTKTSVA